MKAADLREKSAEDLRELEKTLVRDVFQNRLKNFTNRLDDTSAIRKTRRDLARVKTLLREREGVAVVVAGAPEVAPAPTKPEKEEAAAPAQASKPEKSAVEAKAAEPSKGAGEKAKKSSAKAKKSEAK